MLRLYLREKVTYRRKQCNTQNNYFSCAFRQLYKACLHFRQTTQMCRTRKGVNDKVEFGKRSKIRYVIGFLHSFSRLELHIIWLLKELISSSSFYKVNNNLYLSSRLLPIYFQMAIWSSSCVLERHQKILAVSRS